jgi:hypothetical protein
MAAALALALGSGCGESSPAAQDAGPDSYDEHLIEGGGTTGGPIDGLLVLWYFDEPTGEPIAGMRVMVGSDSGSALTGTTDINGQVIFEDPSLSGPTDVHSLADGYPAGSLLGLNATFVTLERREIGYEPDPPTAEIGGTATGWENVPEPDDPQTQFKIAMVAYGLPLEDLLTGDYESIEQAEDPDWEMPVNMLVVGLPTGDKEEWSLEIYDRMGAVTAVAGIYDTVEDTFTSHALALIQGFDTGDPDSNDLILNFSHPIVEENTIEVTIDPIPGEFEIAGAQVMFDLASDGTVALGTVPTTSGDPLEIRLPAVDGIPFAFADAFFTAYAGQDVEDDADNYPNSHRIVRDVTVEAAIGAGIAIDDLLEAPAGLSWDGEELSLDMPSGISYAGAHMEDAEEAVHWGVTMFNPPASSFALPDFPADWGWSGLPDGFLRFEAGAAIVDGDVNEMVFDELWYTVVGSSEAMIEVE